ncbi:MAG TPA: iron-sulfur cluster assembly protein, partial [Bacteroidales bacterium]|nr:iron-sulfur cluster assembly protein [Bacteroidales bacterium]
MIPKDQILSALKKVIHPEKGKDIVALGMVSDISSRENGISLILEPEKSNDPFIPSLKSSIAKTLKDTFGTDTVISQIEIRP